MLFAEFVSRLEDITAVSNIERQAEKLGQLLLSMEREEIRPCVYLCQWPRRPTHLNYLSTTQSNTVHQLDFLATFGFENAPHVSRQIKIASLTISEIFELLSRGIPDSSLISSTISSLPADNFNLIGTEEEFSWLRRISKYGILSDHVIFDAICPPGNDTENQQTRKLIRITYERIRPDLGVIAEAFLADGVKGVNSLIPIAGVPFQPEKLQVWQNIQQATKEWKTGPYIVQPKYRGEQLLIHFTGDKIMLFDRAGQNVDTVFSDIYQACTFWRPSANCVFDSEIVAIDPKTSTFLGESYVRKSQYHLVLLFDIVIYDSEPIFKKPYWYRRQLLHNLASKIKSTDKLQVVYEEIVQSGGDLLRRYDHWVNEMNFEGVVVKKWDGTYRPGKESIDKAKIKSFLDVDFVIVGYNRKKDWRISILVALWDKDYQVLRPVRTVETIRGGKTETEQLLQILTEKSTRNRPKNVEAGIRPPPQFWVDPSIVAAVQVERFKIPTNKYPLGLTFEGGSTLLRIVKDKHVSQADTVQILEKQPTAPRRQ